MKKIFITVFFIMISDILTVYAGLFDKNQTSPTSLQEYRILPTLKKLNETPFFRKNGNCVCPWALYETGPQQQIKQSEEGSSVDPFHSKYLEYELEDARFETLKALPLTPSKCKLIARAGFFYEDNEIKCFCCGLSFEIRNNDFYPQLIHAKHAKGSPWCEFLNHAQKLVFNLDQGQGQDQGQNDFLMTNEGVRMMKYSLGMLA